MYYTGTVIEAGNLIVASDYDRVSVLGPPSFSATFELLVTGKLHLPKSLTEVESDPQPTNFLNYYYHKFRPIFPRTVEGFAYMRGMAKDFNQEIQFILLSGRTPGLHEITIQQIEHSKLGLYFNQYQLNPGVSSAAWKEYNVQNWLAQNTNVVILEDDPRAAMAMARADVNGKKALVYVINNLANHPCILRRDKVPIPKNMIFVNNVKTAGVDLADRMREGKFPFTTELA